MKGNRSVRRSVIAALAVVILSALIACPRAGMQPRSKMTVGEYVEMTLPHANLKEPVIPAVLEIPPVAMEMKLITDFSPDHAFKGKFVDEFRKGAIVYFTRSELFTAVRESGGELSLKMRVLSYEADKKDNPQKILLKIEASLINVNTSQPVLYGKFTSEVKMSFDDLHKPINLAPPGGGKGHYVDQGAFELAKLCFRIYSNIDSQINQNREKIISTLR